MSKRINIVLPDSTVALLNQVAPKGNRSKFISEAVVEVIDARRKKSLRDRLEAACIANAEWDREDAAAWAPLEGECLANFETSLEADAARHAKKRK